ncbi:MAG: hypothetical protein IPK99_09645 [Flavobacteriales bacterium]|nr:hypothetical protein [Flavobacteriales bacterium]
MDTSNDILYAAGIAVPLDYDGNTGRPLFRRMNNAWDTLAVVLPQANALVLWHDTLIVGGSFSSLNGQSYAGIAAWDGSTWHAYGDLPPAGVINRLRVLDGELYALGVFETMDGVYCNGIAKRVGGHWESIGAINTTSNCSVQDLAIYDGHYVAVGGISFPGNPYRDVVIQENGTWGPVGPQGLIGNFAYGRACAVYQGDLYVGGSIPLNAGNAGHGIMRWDGNQWNDVGGGLTYAPNDYTYLTGASRFVERDGLLFAMGSFLYAGGVPASGLATWDGTRWCGLGGHLDPPVYSIAFYQDTLYASCFINADGINVNCAARFIGSSYADTCGVWVGLEEITEEPPLLYPQPAQAGSWVHGLPQGTTRVHVVDRLGRSWQSGAPQERALLLPITLPPGAYVLVCEQARGQSHLPLLVVP